MQAHDSAGSSSASRTANLSILSVYVKIVRLIRNVGDRACAMSHAAAEAYTKHTQRLAAGRGTNGYQVMGIQLFSLQQQHTTAEHWTNLLCVVRV